MATIAVEVQMSGSSDAEAVPIRQISITAVLCGVGSSGPTAQPEPSEPEPEPEPESEKSE